MAGGFPVGLQAAPSVDFIAPSTTYGTTITAGGSGNSVGNYAELVAATTVATSWALISFRTTGAARSFLVDIGVGAGGSEYAIISGLLFATGSIPAARIFSVLVPISIPAGSRVAARCQCTTGVATGFLSMTLFGDAMGSTCYGSSIIQTSNVNTATSFATNLIDPGGSANTKGSYAEIASSTTIDYRGFFLATGPATNTTSTSTSPLWALDIAVGAAGSEKIIANDLGLIGATTSSAIVAVQPTSFAYLPIPIPAGSRIAARCQCSITTASGRLLGIGFYGVPA